MVLRLAEEDDRPQEFGGFLRQRADEETPLLPIVGWRSGGTAGHCPFQSQTRRAGARHAAREGTSSQSIVPCCQVIATGHRSYPTASTTCLLGLPCSPPCAGRSEPSTRKRP